MPKNTLSSGAFARLCRTSKDTLYFYDEQGLLRPRGMQPNGFRFYSADQFFDFDLINVLKSSGSSIAEIKSYLQDLSLAGLCRLLEDKTQDMEQRIAALQLQLAMLSQLKEYSAQITRLRFNEPQITELPEQCFEVGSCSISLPAGCAEISESMAGFINQHLSADTPLGFPMGFIADCALAPDASWELRTRLIFAKSLLPGRGGYIFRKGRYLQYAVQGSTRDHRTALGRIAAFLQKEHLTPAGPLYAFDLLSWLQFKDRDILAAKYVVALAADHATATAQAASGSS